MATQTIIQRDRTTRYTHDCPGCVFLGQATCLCKQSADVYSCPQSGFPTLVFRHADDGPEYCSYPEAAHYRLAMIQEDN